MTHLFEPPRRNWDKRRLGQSNIGVLRRRVRRGDSFAGKRENVL